MKFKEINIIRDRFFSRTKYIASYYNYRDDDNMLEKFSTQVPRKGDCIRVRDKNTHLDVYLIVTSVFIDYLEDKMTVWCK